MITMTTGRYDPTQNAEWQRFRQQTIGDSAMLTNKDKVGANIEQWMFKELVLQVEDWRNRRESFGHGMGIREGERRVVG